MTGNFELNLNKSVSVRLNLLKIKLRMKANHENTANKLVIMRLYNTKIFQQKFPKFVFLENRLTPKVISSSTISTTFANKNSKQLIQVN